MKTNRILSILALSLCFAGVMIACDHTSHPEPQPPVAMPAPEGAGAESSSASAEPDQSDSDAPTPSNAAIGSSVTGTGGRMMPHSSSQTESANTQQLIENAWVVPSSYTAGAPYDALDGEIVRAKTVLSSTPGRVRR